MKSADKIIDDPIKATLFGKFYERILLRWLREKKRFAPLEGKPRVYWKDVKLNQVNSESLRKLKEALERIKQDRQFCTPDGFLRKSEGYYVWEAKNWPFWTEGKKPVDQLRDVLFSTPFFLATKAVYRNREYPVSGFLFSWWSKPEGVESLSKEMNALLAPRTFDVFYTSEVIEECIRHQYHWYLEIVEREKARIEEFFRDLLGKS